MGISQKVMILSLEAALEKARAYCAYQERSQQEVRDRMYLMGLHKSDVEQGIAILIEDGFLNEQRFAVAFAGGKFRINKWGNLKIKAALKAKKISEYCIRKALQEINEEDYKKTCTKIIGEKMKKAKISDAYKKKYLAAQYAIGRGFESELVWDILKMNE